MSEIADMIVAGLICVECQMLIDDEEAQGHPRRCSDCIREEKAGRKRNKVRRQKKRKGKTR